MPRETDPTLIPVYDAAQAFVDAALRTDDSLFTPGSTIWQLEHVEEFHRLFVTNEDTSKDTFNVKLLRQLESASPETNQLAAEMLFFHSLGVSNQGPVSKLAMIQPLLDRVGIEFPDQYRPSLEDGVANHGAGLAHRDAYIRFLGNFALEWKSLASTEAERLLKDPSDFRSFVFDLPSGADAAQRNMLIYLVFPDMFEPIASPYIKQDVVECFGDLVSDANADVDTQLIDIRQALSGKYGSSFQFYDDDLQSQWGTVKSVTSDLPAAPVEAIGAMVEGMYPDPELRLLIVNILADAVAAAHDAGPSSWGLGPDAKLTYLGLNVGRLATVVLHPGRVLISLDDAALDDALRAQLAEASVSEAGRYVSVPSSRYWNLRPDSLPVLGRLVAEALAQHILKAATAVSVTPYARFHSSAAVEYLSTTTGRDIPIPAHQLFPAVSGKSGWDGFVAWAARIFDEERFDDWERNFKLAIAGRLQEARQALLDDAEDWGALLKRAFTKDNNLTPWQHHSKFYTWALEEPDAARTALLGIWNTELEVAERIRGFTRNLPREVVSGLGTRLAIASFLLMVEPDVYPIYRATPFSDAWKLTGWQAPATGADEATVYESALGFMDELRERLSAVGVRTRDRLDAQGLVFGVVHWNEPPQFLTPEERMQIVQFKKDEVVADVVLGTTEVPEGADGGYVEPSFDDILERFSAAGFRIEPDTLLRYHLSLKTRGFVILSGLSGTGKSWLTRLYAEAVGGRSRLVPVAPNWTTNEDLLGFHNPVTNSYVDTDFSRFLREAVAEQATADRRGVPAVPYFLVLDEMNLARVEYYFAKFLSVMEARGHQEVEIELSAEESLPLPANLYTVGTVNVDETTHGFSDKVYDRAQVIELPISGDDVAAHIGDKLYGAMLMSVWQSVETVAPFAFRVVDEVAAYVQVGEDAGLSWEAALDHQVLQKVLPKLARADDRVGEALVELADVCRDVLPLSAEKATAMHTNLEQHGFASYF